MHILIVTDQHPDSLGGVQVALRLQRRFLERAGHTVTIASPALHRRGYVPAEEDRAAYLALPSMPITRDREYAISWPGRQADRALDRGLRAREALGAPPVDLVHVQGDFWGAMIGLRAAERHGWPVIFTMHNNVDHGTRAVTPLAPVVAPVVFGALRAWLRVAVPGLTAPATRSTLSGAWKYLAALASRAELVTAPSQHFADELTSHGVRARTGAPVVVTSGGVDDELVARVRAQARSPRTRPRLVWLGRMSSEKRILECIDAFARATAASGIDADLVLHGAGLLLGKVQRKIRELGLEDRVHLAGPVPYERALEAMHDADALVQSSVGFETQGLTPFEAAALGTPTIFCDPNIAHDLGVQPSWLAVDDSVAALAAAIRKAVTELARFGDRTQAPGAVRVSADVGARLLQSARTAEMIALYERAIHRENR